MISNTNKTKKTSGFTIVELLIVIVVIGILAAITIVSYNGVQKKANTTAAQTTANTIMKKIEAYNAVKATYPTDATAAAYATTLNSDETSSIAGTGFNIAGSIDAGNGRNTAKISKCAGGGAQVFYFDYTANVVTSTPYSAGSTTAPCTPLS